MTRLSRRITMHSLRDTFASHLILDLALDVVQVSRQLGHSKPSITANTYARLFNQARHAEAIRMAMGASDFGAALDSGHD
jgi:integrase